MTKPRVVCLVGPTGVGKSAIALRLAGQFNGEIINADSRQVFEAFPIITAEGHFHPVASKVLRKLQK